METPLYQEKQTMPLRGVYVVLVAVVLLYGGWRTREQTESMLLLGAVVLIAVAVLWGFATLRVVVTASEVRFGFALCRKRVPLQDLTVGEVERIPFLAGMGVHFWGGRWVFNARFGRGLSIITDKRGYLIGSDTPERLQALLQLRPRERQRG